MEKSRTGRSASKLLVACLIMGLSLASAGAQDFSNDESTFVKQLSLLTDDDIGRVISALEFSTNRKNISRGFEWLCPRILARGDFLLLEKFMIAAGYISHRNVTESEIEGLETSALTPLILMLRDWLQPGTFSDEAAMGYFQVLENVYRKNYKKALMEFGRPFLKPHTRQTPQKESP